MSFGNRKMTIDGNYEIPASNELDLNSDEAESEFDNDMADLELSLPASDVKTSKQNSKRNFLAKRKIEQLQEERRLKRLDEDYYDDWD